MAFTTTLVLAALSMLWPAALFPVFPFALLWLGSRLQWRAGWRRRVQVVALVLAGLLHLTMTYKVVGHALGRGTSKTLYATYRRAATHDAAKGQPTVVLIHPGTRFPVLFHQLSGRRHLRATGCRGQRSAYYHLRGSELLVGVRRDVSIHLLHHLAIATGPVDLLLYDAKDGSSSKAVIRWAKIHCRVLARHQGPASTATGTAYRCQAAAPSGGNRCRAVRRLYRN